MAETTMTQIEELTKAFSEKREALAAEVSTVEDKVRSIRLRHMKALRDLVSEAAEAHSALLAAIEEKPGLFVKPKSRVLHGIKLGYRKAKGKVEFADADKVVELIEKHLADQADALIKITKKPIKDALAGLTGTVLKKLGVTVGKTGDIAFIAPADSEIDKLVDALLADDDPAMIATTEAA